MLHGAVFKLTQVYETVRSVLSQVRNGTKTVRGAGKVLLCPPNVVNSAMLRVNLGKRVIRLNEGRHHW